jgi:hypothetical protein
VVGAAVAVVAGEVVSAVVAASSEAGEAHAVAAIATIKAVAKWRIDPRLPTVSGCALLDNEAILPEHTKKIDSKWQ